VVLLGRPFEKATSSLRMHSHLLDLGHELIALLLGLLLGGHLGLHTVSIFPQLVTLPLEPPPAFIIGYDLEQSPSKCRDETPRLEWVPSTESPHLIHQLDGAKPPPLRLTNFLGVASTLRPKQIDVDRHRFLSLPARAPRQGLAFSHEECTVPHGPLWQAATVDMVLGYRGAPRAPGLEGRGTPIEEAGNRRPSNRLTISPYSTDKNAAARATESGRPDVRHRGVGQERMSLGAVGRRRERGSGGDGPRVGGESLLADPPPQGKGMARVVVPWSGQHRLLAVDAGEACLLGS
jgi:hypothetical protein